MGDQYVEFESDYSHRANEFRVFISSTFHDMTEEREYLMKQVFPELHRICLDRGVQFIEIDLRWGITEQQGRKGRIIRTCLDELVRHKPYIIGMIGARYGWIPTRDDIANDAVLLRHHPWIEGAIEAERSLVEMETLEYERYQPDSTDRLRFYCRDYSDTTSVDPIEHNLITAFRERIRASGIPLREAINSPEELGAAVRDDLLNILDRDHPLPSRTISPIDRERRGHEAFASTRKRAYVEQPTALRRLDEFVESPTRAVSPVSSDMNHSGVIGTSEARNVPLVVTGDPGSGKSALLAHWSDHYRKEHPQAFVITHYVGATSTSTDHCSWLRRVMVEIGERYSIKDPIPDTPEQIESEASYWLARVQKEPLILVLDALNQLAPSSLTSLRWLPDYLPSHVRLIVSTLKGEILEQLKERGCHVLRVDPLNESDRRTVIRRYLGEYSKQLSREQTHRVATNAHTANPLFLRTSLEELRLFGTHEELSRKIDTLLEATDLDELFQRVLERIEHDYGERLVQNVMTLLWASRRGLSETELTEILGLQHLRLARLLSALEYRLMRREGLLTFFHDYLRNAVGRRYVPTVVRQRNAHRKLAKYFAEQPPTTRRAEEEPWQWNQAKDISELCDCICDITLFSLLCNDSATHEILGYWSAIGDTEAIVQGYRASLSRFEKSADEMQTGKALQDLGECLCKGGLFDEAKRLLQRAYSIYTDRGDHSSLIVSKLLENMGELHFSMGNFHEAEHVVRRSLSIRQNVLPERDPLIAWSLSSLGAVLYAQGHIDEARQILHSAVMMNDLTLGPTHIQTASALNNLAATYQAAGDYRSAIWYVQQALQILIHHNGTDHPDTSLTMMNLGLLYKNLGDYDKAEQIYTQALAVDERILGERHPRVATNLTTMSTLMRAKGDIDSAEILLLRALGIRRAQFGNAHISTATTLLNLAGLLKEKGEYNASKGHYEKAIQQVVAVLGADHPKSKAAYKGYENLLGVMGGKDPVSFD